MTATTGGRLPVELAESPRIARLARDRDDVGFWREVAAQGTPLIEPADDATHRVVTFLWRGTPDTHRVLVLANRLADRDHLAGSLMRHVDGTDIWHLSYRLPSDYRGTYQFAVDRTEARPDNAHLQALMLGSVPDPINPALVTTGRNGRPSSLMELPDAPEQPWWRPRGVPAGGVEKRRLRSELLGNERSIWVQTPASPPPPDGWTVVVLLDGDRWYRHLDIGHTFDNLHDADATPPLLVVGVDAIDTPTRSRELGGEEPAYVDFLHDELLSWVREEYAATERPDRTILAGQSFGGLTALLAARARPERFRAVIAQSPSLWKRPELIEGFGSPAYRGLRAHLAVGRYEREMVEHCRALHEHLRSGGSSVSLTEYTGGHEFVCWRGGLADALIELTATPS